MAERIALFMYGLTGGGVPRRMTALANALAADGASVDLLVIDAGNRWDLPIHPGVRLTPLGGWRTALPFVRGKRRREFRAARTALERYLRRARPKALISADNIANFTALEARRRAAPDVPVIVTQRTHTSTYMAGKPRLLERLKDLYPEADAVVGVSRAIVEDLVALGAPPENTRVIHNPVVGGDFDEIAARPVDHPWFAPGAPPVVLAAGRIGPQKDFPTLLRAFARARERRPELRLVILGEAEKPEARAALDSLAETLGVRGAVDLPGAAPQAIPYMARAALFVLSSRWEGMPGVLIEAMACGTPVVSTDCPSGPNEALEGGRWGPLVRVGDDAALARAMLDTLAAPPDRDALRARGRGFSVARSLAEYRALVDAVAAKRRSAA